MCVFVRVRMLCTDTGPQLQKEQKTQPYSQLYNLNPNQRNFYCHCSMGSLLSTFGFCCFIFFYSIFATEHIRTYVRHTHNMQISGMEKKNKLQTIVAAFHSALQNNIESISPKDLIKSDAFHAHVAAAAPYSLSFS